MFKRYSAPAERVGGWIGWFEDAAGRATAFVDVNHRVVFVDDLT